MRQYDLLSGGTLRLLCGWRGVHLRPAAFALGETQAILIWLEVTSSFQPGLLWPQTIIFGAHISVATGPWT